MTHSDILRPPTFSEHRACGGCAHYASNSCRHPMAKDQWGYISGMYRYLPDWTPVWPPKDEGDWCGFWRPKA
jgi:hypothetical protein